jgi:hypothetical protein
MAYIGKTPVIGNFVKLDSITVVNGQAAYTMQNGGVNFTSYDNVNQFLVSLNGVLQAPTDSFTVSGSTLTFASNLSTGDVIDFVLVLGNSLDIGTPSDNTVTAAKLNNTSITGQTAETTVADDDTVLIHDTSASALRKMTVSNLTANAGVAGISSSADATAITIDSSENVSIAQNLSFNSGYGSATTAFGVRAWVKFNGTGTISITASGNVSSLSDNGTGDYAITFTNALVDANYAHFANSVKGGGAPSGSNSGVGFGIENRTVNGFGVCVGKLDGTIVDRAEVFGCVIR